ncbi:hypothetical protein LXL04_017297 [Taraxacum kok-saghyz]
MGVSTLDFEFGLPFALGLSLKCELEDDPGDDFDLTHLELSTILELFSSSSSQSSTKTSSAHEVQWTGFLVEVSLRLQVQGLGYSCYQNEVEQHYTQDPHPHFISSIRSNHQTLKRRPRSSSFFSAGKRPSPHPRAFSGDDEGTQPSSCVRRPTAARSISRPDSTEFLLPVLGECFCVSSPMQPSSFRRDLRNNCIPPRTVCCCEEEGADSLLPTALLPVRRPLLLPAVCTALRRLLLGVVSSAGSSPHPRSDINFFRQQFSARFLATGDHQPFFSGGFCFPTSSEDVVVCQSAKPKSVLYTGKSKLELLKLDSNAGLELVWKVVEGPLLFETPVPIPGRGKVDKFSGSRDAVRKDWAEVLLPLFRVVAYVLYLYPSFRITGQIQKYLRQSEGDLSSYAANTSYHQTLKRRPRSSSFFSAGKRPSPHPRAFSGDDEGIQPSSCVRRPTAARSISRPDSTEFLLPVLGECFCVSSPMQPSSFRRDLRTNCIPSRTVCCCEEEGADSLLPTTLLPVRRPLLLPAVCTALRRLLLGVVSSAGSSPHPQSDINFFRQQFSARFLATGDHQPFFSGGFCFPTSSEDVVVCQSAKPKSVLYTGKSKLELLKLDSNAGLELVWKVVEGPLLFETPVPIPGRGKVDKFSHFISSIRSNHQTLKRRPRSSSFFSAGKRPSPHPRAFSGDDEGTQPSSCVRRPTAARSISRPDSTEFLLPVLGECFCVSSPMQPSSFRRDLRTNCIPSRTVCCCEEEGADSLLPTTLLPVRRPLLLPAVCTALRRLLLGVVSSAGSSPHPRSDINFFRQQFSAHFLATGDHQPFFFGGFCFPVISWTLIRRGSTLGCTHLPFFIPALQDGEQEVSLTFSFSGVADTMNACWRSNI